MTQNVAAQQADSSSAWSTIARLLASRRSLLAPGTLGDTVELMAAPPGVLLLVRDGGLLLAMNTSDEPAALEVTGSLVGASGSAVLEGGRLSLPPRCTAWVMGEPAADGVG